MDNEDLKKDLLADITGEKDDPEAISLSGIKPGEVGSKEKPARSLNEFQNIMAEKLTNDNIDKQVDSAPFQPTVMTKERIREWLMIGINLLPPTKKVYATILKARIMGASLQQIAIAINEHIDKVAVMETRAICEVKELISRRERYLNAGNVYIP